MAANYSAFQRGTVDDLRVRPPPNERRLAESRNPADFLRVTREACTRSSAFQGRAAPVSMEGNVTAPGPARLRRRATGRMRCSKPRVAKATRQPMSGRWDECHECGRSSRAD